MRGIHKKTSLFMDFSELAKHIQLCQADMGTSAIVRVIEQCCFNSVSDRLFLT